MAAAVQNALFLVLALAPAACCAGIGVAVKPVSLGTYGGLPCVFLRETASPDLTGRVFPVPVVDSSVPLLRHLFDGTASTAGASKLVNRDGGLYDTLPWSWGRGARPKREAFDAIAFGTAAQPEPSAYHVLLRAIREACCAEVRTGIIETASILDDRDGQLVIGASLSLCESPELVSLYGERVPLPRDEPLRNEVVESLADEMVGVAMAAGVPIEVESKVWATGSVPARFRMDGARVRVVVDAPACAEAAAQSSTDVLSVPKLWEVPSGAAFRAMSRSDLARALLASGQPSLPRPREASLERLRTLAMPLLDEAVRAQAMLSDAIDREDYQAAQRLVAGKSRRQLLMEELGEAVATEDYERAERLRERLDVLTDARMDVTLPVGSYDPYLDQDEWYAEEQRRIYGPKKQQALPGLRAHTACSPRHRGLFTLLSTSLRHRRGARAALRMAWLDDVTNLLLGEQVDLQGADVPNAATQALVAQEENAAEGFDGYALRDLLVLKWGREYDVDFVVTRYLGKSSLYLNIFPWTPDREPFRHKDSAAYLEHLQAVCEMLIEWGRVASVKQQIAETPKKPRRGTIPIKTVPIRLDLPEDIVGSFSRSN